MIRQAQVAPEGSPAISHRQTWRYATVGVLAGIAFPVIASAIKVAALRMPLTPLNMIAAQGLEPVLWITDTAPIFLGLVAAIAGRQQDRVIQANAALRQRELELSAIRTDLEANVLERTRELDERNAQMRSVVAFARQIADVQELNPLLQVAADVIHERFSIYDVNLYLVDERGLAAFLRASSSAEGKGLAEGGFRIALADQGPVGRVARRGRLLTSTVRREGQHAERAALTAPITEQVTVPLSVRGRVIGVLDLLLPTPAPVGQDDIEIIQLVADQLAAALESVRQASETRATVQQLETITAERTRAAWRQYLGNNRLAYQFTPAGVRSLSAGEAETPADPWTPSVPLLLRGQQIGTIVLRTRSGELADTERDLLGKVAAQIALALENVRLLEETRQRAAQEQIISEISARFSRSLDVDALLQAAVREFAALPDVAEATVMLKPSEDQSLQAPN